MVFPWIYIGKSRDIQKRFLHHASELSRNTHANNRVLDIYLKYGLPKLEVLEFSTDGLSKKERSYIKANEAICLNTHQVIFNTPKQRKMRPYLIRRRYLPIVSNSLHK